jgi:uncharacterized protein (UPF0332 family)
VTGDNRRANVAQELAAAKRLRDAAERIANVGELEAAATRLYFAALHAAKAILLTEGIEPKSHRGVHHLLALHFINQRRLPDWVASTFSQLETERDLADYVPMYTVTPERWADRRDGCDRLITELERYLRDGGWAS